MSTVSAPPAHHEHHVQSSYGPPGSVWIRAGWWRALLWTWVAAGIGIALPAGIRYLLGWDWYSRPVTFTTVLFLAPIGYVNAPRSAGRRLLQDPERAPVIRKAFEDYATGRFNKQQMLERVTAEGLLNRRNRPLS